MVGKIAHVRYSRSGCQLKWIDWFRKGRGIAELVQRAAWGLSTAIEPRNVSLPTGVVDNLYSLLTSQLEGARSTKSSIAVIDYRCAARLSSLRFLRSRYCSNHRESQAILPTACDLTHSPAAAWYRTVSPSWS